MTTTRIFLFCLFVFYGCGNTNAKRCDTCVAIDKCQEAISLFTKERNNLKYLRSKIDHATCEGFTVVRGIQVPKICCSDFNVTLIDRINNERDEDNIENHDKFKLLPEKCGKTDGNRIIGGELANLYEFPWMALIAYKTEVSGGKPKFEFQCGGTIIHPRYILTAAHCVKNKAVAGVRVGDYNIKTKVDCQGDGEFYKCEGYYKDVPVKKRIVHEKFNSYPIVENDIALLRLKRAINITRKNVAPICLPIYDELRNKDISGIRATVAGWGVTELNLVPATLRKVVIDIKTDSICRESYASSTRRFNVMGKKFCAGGEGKDSCRGDSGGPLMFEDKYNGQYRVVQYGVVSYGPRQCGSAVPGVYTDLRKYIKWILDNIEE